MPFTVTLMIDRYDEVQNTHNDDTGIDPVECGTFEELSEAVEYRDQLLLGFGTSQIEVDYDLLHQEILTLCDATAFLNEDSSPEQLDRIEGPIDVGHLEGLHHLLGAIYDQRPFPATDEKLGDEQKGDSHAD